MTLSLTCGISYTHTSSSHSSSHIYSWLCHVDDDMYININPLVKVLSKFDPKKEPIYFGRAGSDWIQPRVVKPDAKLGSAESTYHFAVGGMYCLSRALLVEARPYLM